MLRIELELKTQSLGISRALEDKLGPFEAVKLSRMITCAKIANVVDKVKKPISDMIPSKRILSDISVYLIEIEDLVIDTINQYDLSDDVVTITPPLDGWMYILTGRERDEIITFDQYLKWCIRNEDEHVPPDVEKFYRKYQSTFKSGKTPLRDRIT